MRILYFLEDRSQEWFLKSLVNRIATDLGIAPQSLIHEVRSARRGSRTIKEFRTFIKDYDTLRDAADILIVAIDGNCHGVMDRIKFLQKYIKADHPLRDRIAFAIPDPHIEKWYLLDQRAFRVGIGIPSAPDLPEYKCKRDYYKQIVGQALKKSNVSSLLNAAEFAERIVNNIEDLENLGRNDESFKKFVDALKIKFRQPSRSL